MSVYLHDIPLSEAKKRFNEALNRAGIDSVLQTKIIPLDEGALGRVLGEAVWAKISSPHYHAAAMDGFAVDASDTEGALTTDPLILTYESHAVYVDTGDPLPSWANAVIPIEDTEPLGTNGQPAENPRNPHAVRIRSATTPWKNVRSMGEDMIATQLVLPAGHLLRPVDLGAIAGCGHDQVRVVRRARVAILPTGSELVPIGSKVDVGEIIEYNSLVLAAQLRDWGAQPTRFPIIPDEFEAIRDQVADVAKSHDLVLLIAGSSSGSEDFSAEVVKSLGDLLVHGVAVRPGHPVILGMIRTEEGNAGTPIVGVPGYPVSAALTGEIFVKPLIFKWLGRHFDDPDQVTATLTRKVTSPAGDDDYMRVVVGKVGKRTLAAPLSRGAGVISSLVRADGIVVIPAGSQGLPAGEVVEVRLFRSPAEIERTIFAIGSHDITLDLMAQFLMDKNRRLASANVGSLGGLVALRRGESHIAGTHLLDPETGEYNLSYIRQYLPQIPVRVFAFVEREQGLIVDKGNPKAVKGLEDLTRDDIHFINRQRGSGTRVLMDYHLDRLGISADSVLGYDQEEYTHLSIAAAVQSGRADCGLGIEAAARALHLDFIPLYRERYDLVIPTRFVTEALLTPLIELLVDPNFRNSVAELPGYHVQNMGDVLAELES